MVSVMYIIHTKSNCTHDITHPHQTESITTVERDLHSSSAGTLPIPSHIPAPLVISRPLAIPISPIVHSLARPAAIDTAHLTPALTITAATLAIGAAALGRLALDAAAALACTSRPHRGNE